MSHRRTNENNAATPTKACVGRFSYQGLDRVIHEKARLGILASLAVNARGLLFNDLKLMCSLTDGNLSRHLAVLSEAGLLEAWKGTAGRRRPQTMYRLTADGRARFVEYIGVLENVVADAQAEIQFDARQHRVSGRLSPA